jgi:uncharacterized protein (TIGR03435 family)
MKAPWRSVMALRASVLSAAVIMGIAIGVLTAPPRIAYAQAGPVFEVSPAITGSARLAAAHNTARVSRTPERIAFHAALVGDIMAFAYGLPLDRIERRPQWMYDDRYDVAVTTGTPTSLAEQKQLLQRLLEERFGLAVHRVSNPSPVYYLVRGTNVNLKETTADDATDIPELRVSPDQSATPGAVYVAQHMSMSDLAAWLYQPLGLPVLDKTGITGLFDIEISGVPIRIGADGTIRAVRNSLGLDLELHPGTAESLIIDRVERLSHN